ncbi:protein DpdE [Variovorax humicola]|uniref:Protein DpdE n=1 Tax=Variovorax humicola TaxID=1769758 RepID=A0ABU8WAZ0_9BURK
MPVSLYAPDSSARTRLIGVDSPSDRKGRGMASPGDFVEVKSASNASRGIGKLIRTDGKIATVRYFEAPGITVESIQCATADLKVVTLPAQTRVYRRHMAGGRWQAGRVLDAEERVVLVQFPNGDAVNCDVQDLETRWSRPLRDPVPFLIAQATETPFLHEARAAFARAVSDQHVCCVGLNSLLSASVELVDYQFDVVRRVLTDPVQRYLLADEVGLGKTVEAGIIIRQCVLDDPAGAKVVVVVPAPLVAQWRDELSRRFGLKSLLDDFVNVVAHDQVELLAELLPSAELLVVDEAHHLSRQSADKSNSLYDLLKEHTARVPRLLLLSATPVLSDSAGFLRVMHLLDPTVFPLDDLPGFVRRLESRQMIAEIVATLVPDNLYSLPDELDRLASAFTDDPLLLSRIEELQGVLDTFPAEDDETYLSALGALRTHLGETYRLHRRVLRNRRAAFPYYTIQRKGLERVDFAGRRTASLSGQIEQLRLQLSGAAHTNLALRAGLMQWAIHPRVAASVASLLADARVADPEALRLAHEVDAIAQAARSDSSRVEALCSTAFKLLQERDLQIVVFCDTVDEADVACAALAETFPRWTQRHTVASAESFEDEDADEEVPAWQTFISDPSACRILVCDSRAEEGVNLHGGYKVALHYDLPPSANRIEQRLGRLDRFGSGKSVRSVVLVDRDNPNETAWYNLMGVGWGVFDRSVASLQYLIEESAQPLADAWADHGASAFDDLCDDLSGEQGRVARELRRIDQQDALDALGSPDTTGLDLLYEGDKDWRNWKAAFAAFAKGALRFVWRHESSRSNGDEIFRVGYSYRGQQPTLLPMGRFLQTFLAAIDLDSPASSASLPFTHRYACQRSSATSPDGLASNVRLLRIGDPVVTALEEFSRMDDRGRVFGLWRVRPGHVVNDPSGSDLYFRFDYVVEPMTDPEEDGESGVGLARRKALARQAGASLPPLFFSVWVHGGGDVIAEVPSVAFESYRTCDRTVGDADFNLNPSRWRRLQNAGNVTWLQSWESLCNDARSKAHQWILDSAEMREHVSNALAAADGQQALRRAQGQARIARLTGDQALFETQDLDHHESFYTALRGAIQQPELRLDSVGAVFVSNQMPFDDAGSD